MLQDVGLLGSRGAVQVIGPPVIQGLVEVLAQQAGILGFVELGDAVNRLLSYSFAGSQFVFGEFGAKLSRFGVVFAFQVLPIIIFIAAFFVILYYYGVMQFIIRQLAKVMMRFMGASG